MVAIVDSFSDAESGFTTDPAFAIDLECLDHGSVSDVSLHQFGVGSFVVDPAAVEIHDT
jgi:hypothetical protein